MQSRPCSLSFPPFDTPLHSQIKDIFSCQAFESNPDPTSLVRVLLTHAAECHMRAETRCPRDPVKIRRPKTCQCANLASLFSTGKPEALEHWFAYSAICKSAMLLLLLKITRLWFVYVLVAFRSVSPQVYLGRDIYGSLSSPQVRCCQTRRRKSPYLCRVNSSLCDRPQVARPIVSSKTQCPLGHSTLRSTLSNTAYQQ